MSNFELPTNYPNNLNNLYNPSQKTSCPHLGTQQNFFVNNNNIYRLPNSDRAQINALELAQFTFLISTILLLNSTIAQLISCPCTEIGVHVPSPTIFCLNSTNAQLIPCSCMGIGAHVSSSTIFFLLISTGHTLT